MNLDELTKSIKSSTSDKLADDLAYWIEEWKQDDRTVEQLVRMVEKFFGNVWFEKEEDNKTCYNLWKEFRENRIEGLGGMTINERLYIFGLFDRYDSCPSREDQLTIYTKLHAKP
jgi:hypothetical protein